MRQTTYDDALIGLLSSVILQAVEDYQAFVNAGVIEGGLPVGMARLGRTSRSKSKHQLIYHRVRGMGHSTDVTELIEFLTGSGLQFLCDVTGMKACRIRRKLGIEGGAL
jgi:hypothetical protein